jgi:hypothetical protein
MIEFDKSGKHNIDVMRSEGVYLGCMRNRNLTGNWIFSPSGHALKSDELEVIFKEMNRINGKE